MNTKRERREFFDDLSNWTIEAEAPGVRVLGLEYRDHKWFALQVYETHDRFDYQTRKLRPVTEWQTIRYMKFDHENKSFTDATTIPRIVEEIKNIDEEGRHTGKRK